MTAINIRSRNAKSWWMKPRVVAVLVFALAGVAAVVTVEFLRRAQTSEAVTFLSQLQVFMNRQFLETGRYGSGGLCAENMPVSPDLSFEYNCVTDQDGMSYRIRANGKPDTFTAGLEYVVDDAGLRIARCDACSWQVADATLYWLVARP